MTATFQTMIKIVCAALFAALLTVLVSPAKAAIGTVDVVPAATILVPYFETDLNNGNGPQTSVTLTNTSATAILANVVLWTDLGVPTFSFNIYQPGYTSTVIDLRLLFKGVVPITASDGQDPADTISPQGPWSQDINFPGCSSVLPYATPLPAATLTALRNAHTGQSSTTFGGSCGASAYGDGIARGYITIDTINQCGNHLPSDTGYFVAGGGGIATLQNVMTAQVTYQNKSQNQASAEPAVHVEASPVDPLTDGPGDHTFYGRLVSYSGADNREALFAMSQARYFNTPTLTTEAVVWRDPGAIVSPFACGAALPAPFPLGQREFIGFTEDEEFTVFGQPAFTLATQRVPVNSFFSVVGGHFYFNSASGTGDPAAQGRQQHYLSVRHRNGNLYSGQAGAAQVLNAGLNSSNNFVIGSF